MARVDLTLGESVTKDDLTLESVDQGITWRQGTGTWRQADSKWRAPKATLTLESVTKVDLTLENV